MANYPRWVASLTVIDGANRASTMQWYVPEATAKLYFAAADKAARDATAIGLLFAKALLVTDAVHSTQSVTVVDETSPITLPAETALRGNKLTIGFLSGPDQYTQTIPARKASAFTSKPDSIEVDFEEAGALADYVSAFETACLGKSGLAVSVNKAYVND